jgi:hypothetical protein
LFDFKGREEMVAFSLVLTILFMLCVVSSGLDVSFTPADPDPDSSVPLSENYRKHLRKICEVLKKGGTLPEGIQSNKEKFKKMCAKLAADDENIQGSGSSFGGVSLPRKWIFLGLFMGGSFLAWKFHPMILSSLKKSFSSKKLATATYDNDRIAQQDAIRRARIEKLGGGGGGMVDVETNNLNTNLNKVE